jgi:hypothetical protein
MVAVTQNGVVFQQDSQSKKKGTDERLPRSELDLA